MGEIRKDHKVQPLFNFKKSFPLSKRLHQDSSEVDGKRQAQYDDAGEEATVAVNEKNGVLLLEDALCQASCIMLLTLSLGSTR